MDECDHLINAKEIEDGEIDDDEEMEERKPEENVRRRNYKDDYLMEDDDDDSPASSYQMEEGELENDEGIIKAEFEEEEEEEDNDLEEKQVSLNNFNDYDIAPRKYQLEILEAALSKNVIVLLGTGTGKTFIAEMLIKEMSYQFAEGKKTVFICPTDPLVNQQGRDIKKHTHIDEVKCYTGSRKLSFVESHWQKEFENNKILVMTPEIFKNILQHSLYPFSKINLIIFDECHNSVGNSPYQEIMKCFASHPQESWPKIMGLTASLINKKSKPARAEKLIRDLECIFSSTIVTSRDETSVKQHATDPIEKIHTYKNYTLRPDENIHFLNLKIYLDSICNIYSVKTKEEMYRFKQIYDNDMESLFADSLKFFQTPKKGITSLREILLSMGPHCAYFASTIFLDELKKLVLSSLLEPSEEKLLSDTKEYVENFQDLCDIMFMELDMKNDVTLLMSSKMNKVLDILLNRKNILKEQGLCAIIFVKERIEAYALSWWLQKVSEQHPRYSFISSNFVVGHGWSDNNLIRQSMTQKRQLEVLRDFNQNKFNVLVSTSIVEEGLDVRQCNLVMRYEKPPNFRSYVQSKGRARAKQAYFDILIPEEDLNIFMKDYIDYQDIEKLIYSKAINRREPSREDVEAALNNYLIPPYILESTRSRITLNSAVALVYKYCSSLWVSKTKPKLEFKKVKMNEMGLDLEGCQCKITLPVISPLKKEIIGPVMANKELAKKAAALEVCKELHKLGELNDHLLPVLKEVEEEDEKLIGYEDIVEKVEDKSLPQPGTRKRRQTYKKEFPSILKTGLPLPGHPCYLYQICQIPLAENRTCPSNSLGIITLNPLPELPKIPIFTPFGQVHVHLELKRANLKLDKNQINALVTFHCYLFSEMLQMNPEKYRFMPKEAPYMLLLVPLMDGFFDWKLLKTFISFLINKDVSREKSEDAYFVFEKSKYEDAVIYRLYNPHPKYFIKEIVEDYTPRSKFPSVDFADFKAYYLETYNLDIKCDDQPLLAVKQFHTLNLTVSLGLPGKKKKKKIDQERRNLLVPELCVIHPFPASLWQQALCIPSFLHRLVSLLNAHILNTLVFSHFFPPTQLPSSNWRDLVFPPFDFKGVYPKTSFSRRLTFDFHPPFTSLSIPRPDIILTALTTRSAGDLLDLERLEIIGDSFLKYSSTLFLFSKLGQKSEGKLSQLRSKLVCNKHLYKLCSLKNIPGIMQTSPFDAKHTWVPPGYCIVVDDDDANEDGLSFASYLDHTIPDKSTADVIEALIGAYLLTCGPLGALSFMRWLGLKVWDNSSFFPLHQAQDVPIKWLTLPPPSIYVEDDQKARYCIDKLYNKFGLRSLEEKIRYSFNQKVYLVQAFTHPSYTYNSVTDCYQCLEFLGDSILEFLISSYIYHDSKKHSPGDLTLLRSSLLNNSYFAFLSVKHGLNRYIKHSSKDLHAELRNYTEYIESSLVGTEDEQLENFLDIELKDFDLQSNVPKALGDVFESLAGAIYIDSGMSLDKVWEVYYPLMKPALEKFSRKVPRNPIAELTENFSGTKFRPCPKGDEDKYHSCEVVVPKIDGGKNKTFKGEGRNRGTAKRNAARKALVFAKQKKLQV